MNVTLRKAALFFKWGRVPKLWELSFIDRMRGLEKKGLDFNEVLRAVLPELYGEDTSVILRTWVGRKARCNPERFAKTISKMFGASAHSVLGSIDKLADEASLLQRKAPKEPLIQSLLDAIQRIDAAKTAAQPDEPQGKP